jgi:hypothetical protein
MSKMTQTEYPEHTKLRAVKEQCQTAGEFHEWLTIEKGYLIIKLGEGLTDWEQAPGIFELLAEWQGIDQDRLEAEKRMMLDDLRKAKDHLEVENRTLDDLLKANP